MWLGDCGTFKCLCALQHKIQVFKCHYFSTYLRRTLSPDLALVPLNIKHSHHVHVVISHAIMSVCHCTCSSTIHYTKYPHTCIFLLLVMCICSTCLFIFQQGSPSQETTACKLIFLQRACSKKTTQHVYSSSTFLCVEAWIGKLHIQKALPFFFMQLPQTLSGLKNYFLQGTKPRIGGSAMLFV